MTPTATPDISIDCKYRASAETTLRCAKCSRPLMVKDAKRTPVGYVCPYYVKGRVATFYTAGAAQYTIAGAIALVCGLIVGFLLRLVGGTPFSFYIMLFAGPAAGGIVAEVIQRATRKKRGQYIWLVAAIALALGAAPFVFAGGLFNNIWGIVGIALLIGTLTVRLRGSFTFR